MSEATVFKYKSDEIILQQGDTDKNLYKVMSGSVALYINHGQVDEYLVGILSFPKCFGEMTILTGQPSYYTVVALSEATVLRVPESNFEAFIRGDHKNAMNIMKTMARNLSMVNMNMNLLIEELQELSKEDQNLKRLLDSVGMPQPEDLHLSEARGAGQGELASAKSTDAQTGLYPPGHKGYPGITHPEYAAFVYSKEYVCPNCGRKFSGERIFRSKPVLKSIGQGVERYDLQRFYKDFEPEWYEIATCPHCYFSAISETFMETKNLNKKQFEERLIRLYSTLNLDFVTERDLDFVFCQHYLALECAKGLSEGLQRTARLWNSLIWLYHSAGDDEMERYARSKAIDAYQQLYSHCYLEPFQEQQICMKIAGMLYVLGELQSAREWAFKAYQISGGKPVVSDLARQLITDIREVEKN